MWRRRRSRSSCLLCASEVCIRKAEQLADLALKQRLPAVYGVREFAEAGGLLAYGTSLRGMYRSLAGYVGKILKGTSPGELPVLQAATFELVVNLQTAQALGLTIPPSVLARADEVIG